MSKIIKFDPNNFNKHTDDGMELLEKSIKEVGVIESITIDKDDIVVSGNGRKEIFDKLGFVPKIIELSEGEYPVIKTDLEGEKRTKAAIYANTVSLKNINLDTVAIEEAGIDLEEVGIEVIENEETLSVEEDDFEVPNQDEIKTDIVLGDLFEIGDHRLLCGDSTDVSSVEKLMNENKAEMIFTDPPYDFENDSLYSNIIKDFSENAHVFVMHDDKGLLSYLRNSSLEFNRFFVADFKFASPRGNDPYLRHILISHEKNGKAIPHQNLHDGFSSIIKMDYRKNIKEDIIHKHQKPISFLADFIKHYSKENSLVLDIFLGSGATMVASHQLKRKCYGMELDPKYCDVIVRRMLTFDNSLTIKRNGIDETDKWVSKLTSND